MQFGSGLFQSKNIRSINHKYHGIHCTVIISPNSSNFTMTSEVKPGQLQVTVVDWQNFSEMKRRKNVILSTSLYCISMVVAIFLMKNRILEFFWQILFAKEKLHLILNMKLKWYNFMPSGIKQSSLISWSINSIPNLDFHSC